LDLYEANLMIFVFGRVGSFLGRVFVPNEVADIDCQSRNE
jgi:hypothetical protein